MPIHSLIVALAATDWTMAQNRVRAGCAFSVEEVYADPSDPEDLSLYTVIGWLVAGDALRPAEGFALDNHRTMVYKLGANQGALSYLRRRLRELMWSRTLPLKVSCDDIAEELEQHRDKFYLSMLSTEQVDTLQEDIDEAEAQVDDDAALAELVEEALTRATDAMSAELGAVAPYCPGLLRSALERDAQESTGWPLVRLP